MRLTKSCYALTGLACEPPWTVNAGFMVGAVKTLIVDTGSNTLAARTIEGYARAVRPENELVVINTERHLDHINGNAYFRDWGIPIYGHAGIARQDEDLIPAIQDYNEGIVNPVRRAQEEGRVFYANTRIANPDHPIYADTQLDLGQIQAEIIMTPGHTPTNLSIYLPSEGVVYCGDCLVTDYIPNLESGGVEDWKTWLESLAKLQALSPRFIMPGHGEVLEGNRIITEMERTRQILKVAIEKGVAPTLEKIEPA